MTTPDFEQSILPIIDSPPGEGLDWTVMEIIGRAPMRLIPVIVQFLVALRQTPGLRVPVNAIAKRLKTTEAKILDCVAYVPQVVELTSDNRTVILRTAAPAPWEIDPKAMEDLEKSAKSDLERRRRATARAARDAEDTPFNRLRQTLQDAGLILDDARDFAGHLIRTYGFDLAVTAAERAKGERPHEPKSFVIGLIKNGLKPIRAGAGFARIINAVVRPTGSGRTEFIGWEAQINKGIRHKLYRLPDGTLRREPPANGEAVPSLEQDAGFRVAA